LKDNEPPNLEDALSSLASDVIEDERFSSQQEIEINRINEAVNSEALANTNVDSLAVSCLFRYILKYEKI